VVVVPVLGLFSVALVKAEVPFQMVVLDLSNAGDDKGAADIDSDTGVAIDVSVGLDPTSAVRSVSRSRSGSWESSPQG